jgi:L-alanine-DL-glutamate epimerase-like enolase superfamily enzyme
MSNPETVEKVRVYASTIEYQKLDQRLRSVEQILNSGFSAISLSLGGNFDEDIHLIQHVRQLIGDRYLLLDACQGNMAWLGDSKPQRWRLHQALDFAAMIEEFQVEWLEDPIDMYAYDDISVLRSESTVPIAGGRLNAGWHEFKILIDRNSLDIYRPEATISGGIKTAMQVMDACVRRDYHFSPHCGGNSISLLINLHVFAACPRKFLYEFPCEPDRWTPQIRDALLVQPLNIDENGMLDVPQEPGFGIQLDEYALKQHATLWLDAER